MENTSLKRQVTQYKNDNEKLSKEYAKYKAIKIKEALKKMQYWDEE